MAPIAQARERVQSYSDRERLFQTEEGDYTELEELIDEFACAPPPVLTWLVDLIRRR